jgi:hypothetical protein
MAARGVAGIILRISIEEDGKARLHFEGTGSPAVRNSGRRLVEITVLSFDAEERERE